MKEKQGNKLVISQSTSLETIKKPSDSEHGLGLEETNQLIKSHSDMEKNLKQLKKKLESRHKKNKMKTKKKIELKTKEEKQTDGFTTIMKFFEGKQGVPKAKKLIKFLNMLGDSEN